MTAEQQARDMLDRLGMPDAQSLTAGDVVELANLIADRAAIRAAALEEAAKVAEGWKQDTGGHDVYLWPPTHIAATIRALIDTRSEQT